MDVVGLIVIIVVFAVVVLFVKSLEANPEAKGRRGEAKVSAILHSLPSDEYCVLNDIVLDNGSGMSQIDHIVVSLYGIFVIETKNYKGWIFGSETNPYWTQTIYGYKSKFYNPILQNNGHVRALRRMLSAYRAIPIIPIVAFSRECDLKNRHLLRSQVVYYGELRKTIRYYTERVMTAPQVNEIARYIQSNNLTSDEARKQQKNCAKARICQCEADLEQGRCPQCGGKLVLRTGQYGQFYGCSNYPRCRYVMR